MKIIVSGLPRSGTSLAMQILKAGGINTLEDGVRKPDDNNPRGYLEMDNIIGRLESGDFKPDDDWEYKAVKILSHGIKSLPSKKPGEYVVFYCTRNIEEIMDSQDKMAGVIDKDRGSLNKLLIEENLGCINHISKRYDMSMFTLDYNHIMSLEGQDWENYCVGISDYLGRHGFIHALDIDGMMEARDSNLYRNRLSDRERMRKRLKSLGYLE